MALAVAPDSNAAVAVADDATLTGEVVIAEAGMLVVGKMSQSAGHRQDRVRYVAGPVLQHWRFRRARSPRRNFSGMEHPSEVAPSQGDRHWNQYWQVSRLAEMILAG